MGYHTNGLLDGKKGYTPPYKDHEAMCVVKQHGVKGEIGVGGKRVTEGRKISTPSDGGKGGGNHSRGYKSASKKRSR
jgi:hypothetical protein